MGCAKIWNAAVALVPRSARPLRMDSNDPQRTEVPFWRVDEDDHRRTTATVADLHRSLKHDTPLLPKAFLMTAIVRSDDCLEMIHGTGGGRYEVVTEAGRRFPGPRAGPGLGRRGDAPTASVPPGPGDRRWGVRQDAATPPARPVVGSRPQAGPVEAIGPHRADQGSGSSSIVPCRPSRERCTEIADRLADLERRLEVDRRSIAAVDASRDRTCRGLSSMMRRSERCSPRRPDSSRRRVRLQPRIPRRRAVSP